MTSQWEDYIPSPPDKHMSLESGNYTVGKRSNRVTKTEHNRYTMKGRDQIPKRTKSHPTLQLASLSHAKTYIIQIQLALVKTDPLRSMK